MMVDGWTRDAYTAPEGASLTQPRTAWLKRCPIRAEPTDALTFSGIIETFGIFTGKSVDMRIGVDDRSGLKSRSVSGSGKRRAKIERAVTLVML